MPLFSGPKFVESKSPLTFVIHYSTFPLVFFFSFSLFLHNITFSNYASAIPFASSTRFWLWYQTVYREWNETLFLIWHGVPTRWVLKLITEQHANDSLDSWFTTLRLEHTHTRTVIIQQLHSFHVIYILPQWKWEWAGKKEKIRYQSLHLAGASIFDFFSFVCARFCICVER